MVAPWRGEERHCWVVGLHGGGGVGKAEDEILLEVLQ